MKRWIHATDTNNKIKKPFKYPEDIAEVEKYVADNYKLDGSLDEAILCQAICEGLAATEFSNLEATRITSMWINGTPKGFEHWVCKVKGDAGQGCKLIDPTVDQFFGITKRMQCAAFGESRFGYLSENYVPLTGFDSYVDSDMSVMEFYEMLNDNYPDVIVVTI